MLYFIYFKSNLAYQNPPVNITVRRVFPFLRNMHVCASQLWRKIAFGNSASLRRGVESNRRRGKQEAVSGKRALASLQLTRGTADDAMRTRNIWLVL